MSVSAGATHSVVVNADGSAWAFGADTKGELGFSGLASRATPTAIPGLRDAQEASAGDEHTLVLRSDGLVYAFGSNGLGELGQGTVDDYPHPAAALVPGLNCVVSVAAGGHHSVALRADGTVWTFGRNDFGELGRPQSTAVRIGATLADPTPAPVQGLSNVIAIAAGASHTLALRSDGTVWAFGWNWFGQLGTATNNRTNVANANPQPVPGLNRITSVAAGGSHSLAVGAGGTVVAFGLNNDGQLGTTHNAGTTDPNPEPALVKTVSGVILVRAGAAHTVALRSDGSVWTFGRNDAGQLGTTTNLGPTSSSNPVANPIAARVPSLDDVTTMSAGYGHTLVVRSDGTVWGFGYNAWGQIGRPTAAPSGQNPTPEPIDR